MSNNARGGGKMTIATDFDGTLCIDEFPLIGEPRQHVIKWCKDMKKQGNILILWTCREDIPEGNYLTKAVKWCGLQELKFDYINENPLCNFGHPELVRKIVADVYLDDRAMNVNRLEGLR